MTNVTIEKSVHFRREARGRHELQEGPAPNPVGEGQERVPRVARLMALAIRFEGLLLDGSVSNQAELAHLGRVTRARVSQILALVHLAPDIQEEVLFLRDGHRGAHLILADLRPISAMIDWTGQRRRWRRLRRIKGC
jgi:hypothetical protein